MSLLLNPASINFTVSNHLNICKHSDWIVTISISDRENGIDTNIDLTGYTGKCTIKSEAGSDIVIAEPIVAISNNTLTVSLDSSITDNIPTDGTTYDDVSTYQYDIYLSKDSDNFRVMQGYVEVSPTVTKESD